MFSQIKTNFECEQVYKFVRALKTKNAIEFFVVLIKLTQF